MTQCKRALSNDIASLPPAMGTVKAMTRYAVVVASYRDQLVLPSRGWTSMVPAPPPPAYLNSLEMTTRLRVTAREAKLDDKGVSIHFFQVGAAVEKRSLEKAWLVSCVKFVENWIVREETASRLH